MLSSAISIRNYFVMIEAHVNLHYKSLDNISHSYILFFMCMFYQLLCVQHSCSSTQSWGSVIDLPSIVETRGQNSRGCPFSFQIGIWDLFVHR